MTRNLGNSALAKAKLEEAIARGLETGRRVIPRILANVPQDEIQAANQTGLVVRPGVAEYRTRLGTSKITPWAFGQLCDRVGGAKFAAYAAEQLELSRPAEVDRKAKAAGDEPEEDRNAWRAQHLQDLAARHFEHARGRYLIRRLEGQVCGVLSDQFKRVDSRPMLEAFLGAVQEFGAVPAGGEITETRAVVRVIIPRTYEIAPGEHVAYGMQFVNSDFGNGSYGLSDFLLRLLCLNGATGDLQLRQIHLGKRISEDIELSRRTHELDTKTLVSATIDTVGVLLSDVVLDQRTKAIGELCAQKLSFPEAMKFAKKRLTKAEELKAKELYEGPDTLNVPPGETLWRFSNCLSFLANDEKAVPSADRRVELQEIAGRMLPQISGKKDEKPKG